MMSDPVGENQLIPNVSEYLAIFVQPLDGNIALGFVVLKKSPLKELMRASCHVFRIPLRAHMFRFKGNAVNDTDTSESLGIENWDIIEMSNAQDSAIIVSSDEITTTGIMIRLSCQDNDYECNCHFLRTVPVIRLLDRYRRSGVFLRALRLSYQGITIADNDTAASLGMENGDTLDIVCAQFGG